MTTTNACTGERCTLCGEQATFKVGEEILPDDPMPHRHNLTAYVCTKHFWAIVGGPDRPRVVDAIALERAESLAKTYGAINDQDRANHVAIREADRKEWQKATLAERERAERAESALEAARGALRVTRDYIDEARWVSNGKTPAVLYCDGCGITRGDVCLIDCPDEGMMRYLDAALSPVATGGAPAPTADEVPTGVGDSGKEPFPPDARMHVLTMPSRMNVVSFRCTDGRTGYACEVHGYTLDVTNGKPTRIRTRGWSEEASPADLHSLVMTWFDHELREQLGMEPHAPAPAAPQVADETPQCVVCGAPELTPIHVTPMDTLGGHLFAPPQSANAPAAPQVAAMQKMLIETTARVLKEANMTPSELVPSPPSVPTEGPKNMGRLVDTMRHKDGGHCPDGEKRTTCKRAHVYMPSDPSGKAGAPAPAMKSVAHWCAVFDEHPCPHSNEGEDRSKWNCSACTREIIAAIQADALRAPSPLPGDEYRRGVEDAARVADAYRALMIELVEAGKPSPARKAIEERSIGAAHVAQDIRALASAPAVAPGKDFK